MAKYLAIIEKNTNEIFDKYFSNFFVIINQIILFIVAVAYLAYKNILLTILILATGMLSISLPQIFVGQGTYNYLLNNCPEFVDLLHKVKNVKEDIDHEVCKVAE